MSLSVNPTSQGRRLPTYSRGLLKVHAFLKKEVFLLRCHIVLTHVHMQVAVQQEPFWQMLSSSNHNTCFCDTAWETTTQVAKYGCNCSRGAVQLCFSKRMKELELWYKIFHRDFIPQIHPGEFIKENHTMSQHYGIRRKWQFSLLLTGVASFPHTCVPFPP